jgi:hypothetical protein
LKDRGGRKFAPYFKGDAMDIILLIIFVCTAIFLLFVGIDHILSILGYKKKEYKRKD